MSGSGGGYTQRPYRMPRIDLGAHDEGEGELDYSYPPPHAGPSTSSRHTASKSPPSSNRDYHDQLYSRSHHGGPSHPPHRPQEPHPRAPHSHRTPSPEPDRDVLAYVRAQQDTSSLDPEAQRELRLAEQLKKETFQHGASRVKSRVQREREAEERKKKQAEEDATKAYAEFVAAMQGDDSQSGGMEREKKSKGFVKAGGDTYVAPRASAVKKTATEAFGEDSDHEDKEKGEAPKRKRIAMESFLSELQVSQAERESRLSHLASTSNKSISTLLAHETLSKPGSRDLSSDPLTTNICILSLPPNVDERAMGGFFRKWGDVATVKIMWPRGEQRERVSGLTGFVAYMTRGEAERAFKEADGAIWGGVRVKMSWGKAMPLPTKAAYPHEERREERAEPERSRGKEKGGVPRLVIRHRRRGTRVEELGRRVEDEYGETQRLFIETVASRIKSNGAHFEHILREKEGDNPKFSFLHPDSNLHTYFRLCLDPSFTPQEADFCDTGSDSLYSTDSGDESETHHSPPSSLGPLARRRLLSMLRGLTLRRERIARITSFALDHASSYSSIVDILASSLLQPRTPIPRKLARLYALSDILHNSGAPVSNAWRYRASIEEKLVLIFAHWGQVVRSFAGRMKREEIRGKIRAVLEVWEGWIVVGPQVMVRVMEVFENPPPNVKGVQEGKGEEEDLDGEAMGEGEQPAKTGGETKQVDQGEDLDGEALGEDEQTAQQGGEQKANIEQEEDLDGEALDEEEDLDGEAL